MIFFFLHALPSTIAFSLEYVLFYQFYAKITTCTFFDQEKFGTTPLLYVTLGRIFLSAPRTHERFLYPYPTRGMDNQRTNGPVNAHLTPGPGISFSAFIHVYSPRAGDKC